MLEEAGMERCLGRKLALKNEHEVELGHRLDTGRKALCKLKDAHCCRNVGLKSRNKLFEPRALYAYSAWTMTSKLRKSIEDGLEEDATLDGADRAQTR